ncbi:MAG: hypothetical protein FWG05_04010 [Kiritimatiellaeota bacterium]|nr:hypothetical protein [Kiritimatiellota bacterium]
MKKSLVIILCAGVLFAGAARAEEAPEFTVRPVKFTCAAPLPEALVPKFSFADEDATTSRYDIVFMISGTGIIAVMPDTLRIESVKTPDGAEISRDYRDLSNCAPGRENTVAKDGKSGLFSVSVKSDAPAPKASPTVRGSIKVKTSAKAETATRSVKVGDAAETAELGPFGAEMSIRGGTLRVKLTGQSERLVSLEAVAGGQKLPTSVTRTRTAGGGFDGGMSFSSSSTEFSGGVTKTTFNQNTPAKEMANAFVKTQTTSDAAGEDTHSYSFPMLKGADEATLSLTYWDDPQERAVPFEVTVF